MPGPLMALGAQSAMANPQLTAGAGSIGLILMLCIGLSTLSFITSPCWICWICISSCISGCFGDDDETFIVGSQNSSEQPITEEF